MPKILSGLDRARTALEERGSFPGGALPGVIADSWRRSLDAGLDPLGDPVDAVIPQTRLRQERQRHETVRRLALTEMELLYNQIAGSNFMIALGSPDGVVLDTVSDSDFAHSDAGKAIIPGSVWTEPNRGTNALGLCIQEGAPVAVYGGEHFFRNHNGVSCISAPIFNSSGEVAGLLDASSSFEARQQHTMALVQMAALHIENGLIFAEQSNSIVVLFHPRREFLNSLSAGVIALSEHGEIESINQRGRLLLEGLKARADSAFDDLFDATFEDVARDLVSGNTVLIRDRVGSAVFLTCPVHQHSLVNNRAIKTHLSRRHPVRSSSDFGSNLSHATDGIDFVAEDGLVQRHLAAATAAVKSQIPVHITGQTGTGKELIARHLHKTTGRTGEFIPVNCGAIPENLFVSELFGYAGGSFTDARKDGNPGLAHAAHKGTLFLDEVGEIPLQAQAALLRFLDDFEIRRVGGSATSRVDVQILSATNRDLHASVNEDRFRPDLLYRLNAVTISLPPLRDRTDFSPAVRFLLETIDPTQAITNEAIQALAAHDWPGNFRELKSKLQQLCFDASGGAITDDYVCQVLPARDEFGKACPNCRGSKLQADKCRQILDTYERTGHNISKTARILGVSRTTLYRHLPKH